MRALVVLALLVLQVSCTDDSLFDEPGGIVVYPEPGADPDAGVPPVFQQPLSGPIVPIYGHVSRQARVEYYDLGEVKLTDGRVPLNAMYFFFDENGSPLFFLAEDGSQLVGWHPVVDIIPTRAGYSPFWRVYEVRVKGTASGPPLDDLKRVPELSEICQMDAVCPSGQVCIEQRCSDPINVGDYQLDGIKSLSTLNDNDVEIKETGTIINCPIANLDGWLVGGLTSPDIVFPTIQLWYKRLTTICFLLQGGPDLLGATGYNLQLQDTPPMGKAYFLEQNLASAVEEPVPVSPMRRMVITEFMPGRPEYTPLVRRYDILPDTGHRFDVRSIDELKKDPALKIEGTDMIHNLVIRGTLPACSDDTQCAAIGLPCGTGLGYCGLPFARLYEPCTPWIYECDPTGGPSGTPLACVALKGNLSFFCFNGCDATQNDTDPNPDQDSRCNSVQGFECLATGQSDSTRPSGVCVRTCTYEEGKEEEMILQCASPTCGDGTLDLGETCDDGNVADGDGCNQHCTFLGTEKEEESPYRATCMASNHCWVPDERADWFAE